VKVVVDSSGAVKLVVHEYGREAAFKLLRTASERLAPRLLLAEVGNTFWKKIERGELSSAQAAAGLPIVEDAITRFVDDGELVADALKMAIELRHPIYDCLYLTLAAREGAMLVTGDLRLLRKVQTTRLSSLVRPLVAVS
jgi:predicted nucleic acid-binding protein